MTENNDDSIVFHQLQEVAHGPTSEDSDYVANASEMHTISVGLEAAEEVVLVDHAHNGNSVKRTWPVNLSKSCSVTCTLNALFDVECHVEEVAVYFHGATELNVDNVLSDALQINDQNLSCRSAEDHSDAYVVVETAIHTKSPDDLCSLKHPNFVAWDSEHYGLCAGVHLLSQRKDHHLSLKINVSDWSTRTNVVEAVPSKVETVANGRDAMGDVKMSHEEGTCSLPEQHQVENHMLHTIGMVVLIVHLDLCRVNNHMLGMVHSAIAVRDGVSLVEKQCEKTTIQKRTVSHLSGMEVRVEQCCMGHLWPHFMFISINVLNEFNSLIEGVL